MSTIMVQNEDKSMTNFRDMASELKKLLSPEKALQILYTLVAKNPVLWRELDDILHPNTERNEDRIESISNVLTNLRSLQLSQLPLETLGIITQFLPFKSCLNICETNLFFNKTIPKYIDIINLDTDICESIYQLLSKCERLRYLSIDGTYKENDKNNISFSFPWSKVKSVRDMTLINVELTDNNMYKFEGGTYSLCDLHLVCLSNINITDWLTFTSRAHCPNLTNLTIDTSFKRNDELNAFTEQILSSKDHTQITNLSLTINNLSIIKSLRMNKCLIANLRKLEIGLVDKKSTGNSDRFSSVNVSDMFRALFCAETAENDRNYYVFKNLEMLSIDFCPNHYCQGYNDISPEDLSNFMQSIPKIFPALKLLALYGSTSQLLFNQNHLNGLLFQSNHNIILPQIIDLSIGFEADLDLNITDILNTFPNLAWLTLQNECFLADSPKDFHKIVNQSISDKSSSNLQWITLCASQKDKIYELTSGIFVEYWDRPIHCCDFDAALNKSKEIFHNKSTQRKKQYMGSIPHSF